MVNLVSMYDYDILYYLINCEMLFDFDISGEIWILSY